MGTFSYTEAPTWVAQAGLTAVADPKGWVDSVSGEVYVAIGGLDATQTDLGGVPTFAAVLSGYSVASRFNTGATITFTVTANEDVITDLDITGTPRVTMSINGTTRYATLDKAASTGTVLVFKYTVVSGDVATAGQFTTLLTMTNGTISDALASGGSVALTAPQKVFTIGAVTGVSVNA